MPQWLTRVVDMRWYATHSGSWVCFVSLKRCPIESESRSPGSALSIGTTSATSATSRYAEFCVFCFLSGVYHLVHERGGEDCHSVALLKLPVHLPQGAQNSRGTIPHLRWSPPRSHHRIFAGAGTNQGQGSKTTHMRCTQANAFNLACSWLFWD